MKRGVKHYPPCCNAKYPFFVGGKKNIHLNFSWLLSCDQEKTLLFTTHTRTRMHTYTHVSFVLVSLFNGISTFVRLINAKAILREEQQWYYLTHSWEDKGVHTFPKGICPKVNVIARLEYELAYYDSAVHCFNHYTTRTPPYTHIQLQRERGRDR